jgi:hypothetical protein
MGVTLFPRTGGHADLRAPYCTERGALPTLRGPTEGDAAKAAATSSLWESWRSACKTPDSSPHTGGHGTSPATSSSRRVVGLTILTCCLTPSDSIQVQRVVTKDW